MGAKLGLLPLALVVWEQRMYF